MNTHTRTEVRKRAAERGFDSPEHWKRENRKWFAAHNQRKETRDLAQALEVEYTEWLEGYEGLAP